MAWYFLSTMSSFPDNIYSLPLVFELQSRGPTKVEVMSLGFPLQRQWRERRGFISLSSHLRSRQMSSARAGALRLRWRLDGAARCQAGVVGIVLLPPASVAFTRWSASWERNRNRRGRSCKTCSKTSMPFSCTRTTEKHVHGKPCQSLFFGFVGLEPSGTWSPRRRESNALAGYTTGPSSSSNAFDSSARWLGTAWFKSDKTKKRLFGLAARNRLSLSLPLSFSPLSYFLSFSIQKWNLVKDSNQHGLLHWPPQSLDRSPFGSMGAILNPVQTRGGGGSHCAPQVHFVKYLQNSLSSWATDFRISDNLKKRRC